MDIEKIKLTQAMRKTATADAITFKFGAAVEDYRKELVKVVTQYVSGVKANALLLAEYDKLSPEIRELVRISNGIRFSQKAKDPKSASTVIYTALAVNLRFLSPSGKDTFAVFGTSSELDRYHQGVNLHSSICIKETDFMFPYGKIPSVLGKVLAKRAKLISEIEKFGEDTYHALFQVKNIKEVRKYVPSLEQFLDIPDKKFTKIVPYEFYDKVNKSINTAV